MSIQMAPSQIPVAPPRSNSMQNVVITEPQYVDEQHGFRAEDRYSGMDELAASVHFNPDAPVRLQDFTTIQERVSKIEERVFETEIEVARVNNTHQSALQSVGEALTKIQDSFNNNATANTIRKISKKRKLVVESKVGFGLFMATLIWLYTYIIVGSLLESNSSMACINTDPNWSGGGYVMGSAAGLELHMPSHNGFYSTTFLLSNYTFTTARMGEPLEEVTPNNFERGRDNGVGLSKGVVFYISHLFGSMEACYSFYIARQCAMTTLTLVALTYFVQYLFEVAWWIVCIPVRCCILCCRE